MKDIEIVLEDKPGQLAVFGELLGANKISLEGGGVFRSAHGSIGHFLVKDGDLAKTVLQKAGIEVKSMHDVIVQKLRQDIPGQLGLFCRKLAQANVNIIVQYSDHANQLILVVDNYERGKLISEEWMKQWWDTDDYII